MKTILPVPHLLGGHCASSAFRDLVAFHSPAESAALPSEALLFALSGGLDFLYWRRPVADPPIYLLGRTGPLEAQLAARLGIGFQEVRPASPEAAWAWLRATLAAGQPALVLADVGELPYLNARTHFTGHRLLVIGIDDQAGTLFVLDNDRAGVQEIAQAAFDASWRSTAFPAPIDYRYYEVRWPAALPDPGAHIREAVAETVRLLDGHGIPFVAADRISSAGDSGLAGMEMFAADLARWPEHFAPEEVTQALRAVYLYVEKAGTGFGGFFRGIYGTGLREAATRVADPALATALDAAGAHYQALGRSWSAFAAACRAAAPAAIDDPAATLAPLLPQAADLLAAERAGRDLLAGLAAI
jgi:butirosin biosynthesis protein H-like/uncharacterized protein DUF4872